MFKKILAAISLSILLTACNSSPLIGSWEKSGQLENDFGWYINYTFKRNNTVVIEGYPPLYETKEYKILEQDGNTFVVEICEIPETFTISEDGQSMTSSGNSE